MLPLMTCGDIFRIIIALFIPPLGVFTQVGLTQPFLINPGDLSLCRWWPWVPSLVWHVASRCDPRPVCHSEPQINRVSAIWL